MEKNSNSKIEHRRLGLRVFIAFLVLAAVFAGVLWPSYLVKSDMAAQIFGTQTFAGLSLEIRHHIRRIELGLKNGQDMITFSGIYDILRDIRRRSSYTEGVYVIGYDDTLLYSIESADAGKFPLRRPAELSFGAENSSHIQLNGDYYDMLLPVFDAQGRVAAIIMVRLNRQILHNSLIKLINRGFVQSVVIAALFLGFALAVIISVNHRAEEKRKAIRTNAIIIFTFALAALSVDLGLTYIFYSEAAESATVQTVNRVAYMLQEEIDSVLSMGVPADALYDLNSWLHKSVQSDMAIRSVNVDEHMRVSLTVSPEYVNKYNISLLKSYAVIYLCFFGAGAAALAAALIVRFRRKGGGQNAQFGA